MKNNFVKAEDLIPLIQEAPDRALKLMQKGWETEIHDFFNRLLFDRHPAGDWLTKERPQGLPGEGVTWLCLVLTVDDIKADEKKKDLYLQDRFIRKAVRTCRDMIGKMQGETDLYDEESFLNQKILILGLGVQEDLPAAIQKITSDLLILNQRNRGYVLTVGLGRPRESLEELKESKDRILEALSLRHISGLGGIILEPEKPFETAVIDQFSLPLLELEHFIRNGESKSAAVLVENIYRNMKAGNGLHLKDARLLTVLMARTVIRAESDKGEEWQEPVGRLRPFETMCSLDGMKDALVEITEHAAEQRRESGNRKTKLAEEAIHYIAAHYSEDKLTLKTVANVLNISVPYLTLLLRNETGKTFGQHLLETRMEVAKELLRTTDESVSRIAGKVGYTSSQYFSTCFRNYVGMSPGKYKEG